MARKPSLNVTLPDEVREALDRLAAERSTAKKKIFAGDIVREAVQEYLTNRGIQVDVSVDRGGYRVGEGDKAQE